jgi:threonine synthase
MIRAGARVLRTGRTYEDAVAASHRLTATREGVADVNVDGPYAAVVASAHATITEELADLPGGPPADVWVPVGNGTTLAAVAAAMLRRGWPTRPVGVSSQGNNSILGSWPRRTHRPLDPASLAPTRANEPLVNCRALHGQAALDVLHTTGGRVTGIPDPALEAAALVLRRAGLRVSPAGAAGFAGLLAAARTGLPGGVHVAILTG